VIPAHVGLPPLPRRRERGVSRRPLRLGAPVWRNDISDP
jgi:hypothetical protein